MFRFVLHVEDSVCGGVTGAKNSTWTVVLSMKTLTGQRMPVWVAGEVGWGGGNFEGKCVSQC